MFALLREVLLEILVNVRVRFSDLFFSIRFDQEMIQNLCARHIESETARYICVENVTKCLRKLRFSSPLQMFRVYEDLLLLSREDSMSFLLIVFALRQEDSLHVGLFRLRTLSEMHRRSEEFLKGMQKMVEECGGDGLSVEDIMEVEEEERRDFEKSQQARIDTQAKEIEQLTKDVEEKDKAIQQLKQWKIRSEDKFEFAMEFVPSSLQYHLDLLMSDEATESTPEEKMEHWLSYDWVSLDKLGEDGTHAESRFTKVRCNPWHHIYYNKVAKKAYLVDEDKERFKKLKLQG